MRLESVLGEDRAAYDGQHQFPFMTICMPGPRVDTPAKNMHNDINVGLSEPVDGLGIIAGKASNENGRRAIIRSVRPGNPTPIPAE
jgi:hypothetical protein